MTNLLSLVQGFVLRYIHGNQGTRQGILAGDCSPVLEHPSLGDLPYRWFRAQHQGREHASGSGAADGFQEPAFQELHPSASFCQAVVGLYQDRLTDAEIEAFFADHAEHASAHAAHDPLAAILEVAPGERATLTRTAAAYLKAFPAIRDDDERVGDFLAMILDTLRSLQRIEVLGT